MDQKLSDQNLKPFEDGIKSVVNAEYCKLFKNSLTNDFGLSLSWNVNNINPFNEFDEMHKSIKILLGDISDKMSIGKIQDLKDEIKLLNETIEEQKYKIIDLERYKTYVDIVREITYNPMNNWNAQNDCKINNVSKINKI